jgi:hypothetical protein
MNILAYTELTGKSYPGFVSINKDPDGDVRVSVRASPNEDGSEGKQVSIVVPRDEWARELARKWA